MSDSLPTAARSVSPRNRFLLLSFLASLAVYTALTWPLPREFSTAIISSHRPALGGSRISIPGDHLQLLYYFQLVEGFLTGDTPWFHNLYEFNLGDDSARFKPDFYYAPFSLIHSVFAIPGTPALGWNLTGFFAVWFGLAGTWRLVTRYPAPLAVHLAATALGVLFPYRWVTLLHGSPTGLAMGYVPWILLGLDLAIRDRKFAGGILAGAALLLSGWADTHTFFFSALLIPFWCILVFLYDKPDFRPANLLELLKALSGFIVFGVLVIVQVFVIRALIGESSMSDGRDLSEIMIYTPRAAGFLSPDPDHLHNSIYLTYSGLALILLALVVNALRVLRKPAATDLRRFALQEALLFGLALLAALSLGPNLLPHNPTWWHGLVRRFPPYGMIRQTAKVLCIFPALAAVAVTLPFSRLKKPLPRWMSLAVMALPLLLFIEVSGRIDPTLSKVDPHQGAYAAVRANAEARGETAHALGVVLWPGDSHWTSQMQYYGVTHGVRMVNGYLPNAPANYEEDVFYHFVSINQGHAPDALLDELLSLGIRHIIVHEDAFPEKVSPFGIAQTLNNFLAHPRMKLLEQDHAVWAFEILDTPSPEHIETTPWDIASTTMVWQAGWYGNETAEYIADPLTYRGGFLRLDDPADHLRFDPYYTHHRDSFHIPVRLRGTGTLHLLVTLDGTPLLDETREINAPDWTWENILFPPYQRFPREILVTLRAETGILDMDYAYMADGPTPAHLAPGETFSIPASSLFHAGHSDRDTGEVVLLPERVVSDEVIYGPRLPLPPGNYTFTLHYQSSADDVLLGHIRLREPEGFDLPAHIPVPGANTSVTLEYTQPADLPVVFAFRYLRTAEMRVSRLEITRKN